MRIADLAMTAGAIAPSGCDNYMVALFQPRGFGHHRADLVYDTRDFMTWCNGHWDVSVFLEIPVHELYVAATHPAGLDIDENLVGLNVRNRYILQDERFAIFVDACCFHGIVLSSLV